MSEMNDLFEDPSAKVEHFRSTYNMLKSSPDMEPPRRIMFEFEKPRPAGWLWRWLAPMTASAAVAFAVVTLTPRPQALAPQVVREVQQQVPAPAPTQVDYQAMIDQLRGELGELRARDAVQTKEIRRVWGEMDLMAESEQQIKRDNLLNQSNIQQLESRVKPASARIENQSHLEQLASNLVRN
jgi:hypothetical protein